LTHQTEQESLSFNIYVYNVCNYIYESNINTYVDSDFHHNIKANKEEKKNAIDYSLKYIIVSSFLRKFSRVLQLKTPYKTIIFSRY
jgi:hypothetical protein